MVAAVSRASPRSRPKPSSALLPGDLEPVAVDLDERVAPRIPSVLLDPRLG
jgi:hypothetical protein